MDSLDSVWRSSLWKQFGAAIDMLDNAVMACPDSLWREPVWHDPTVPSQRVEFWYVVYHALFWLDLYLFGSEEGFAPPPPFALVEQDDAAGPLPHQSYSRDELSAYLTAVRQKCRATIETMTEQRAPPRQLRVDERRRGRHLPRATTVQHAPCPGTCRPTEPVAWAARRPG